MTALSSEGPRTQKAPCSNCLRETTHIVLYRAVQDHEEFLEEFVMIRCQGCDLPSMHTAVYDSMDDHFVGHRYYPSPRTRQLPRWVLALATPFQGDADKRELGNLLREAYEAVRSGHYRLAAMGIRAALEASMINAVGDHGTFERNMDEFASKGFISRLSREAMKTVIEVGHAAIHRLHAPSEKDIGVALDVLEGILGPIYSHEATVKRLSASTPKRKPRKPKAKTP